MRIHYNVTAMKNRFWLLIVIVLSALALSVIEKYEERRGVDLVASGQKAKIILVGLDATADGCGDIYQEYEIPVVSKRMQSVIAALISFEPPEGLVNPLAEHDLHVAIKDGDKRVKIIDLIGTPALGGLCDSMMLKEQIERTVELYAEDYEIWLNGSVEDYECMRLITGGCSLG